MEAKIISFQQKQKISIVQLTTDKKNTFSYISGEEAIKKNKIEVMEINESGSVNNISILNKSKDFVFFMDGDILIGAKQNRVLNTSVLLFPESKTIIPVSCIEAGRWRFSSRRFHGADYSVPHKMRSAKAHQVNQNLNTKKAHESNQNNIWSHVKEYQSDYAFYSSTSNLSDIFDAKKEDFELLIKDFNLEEDANGIAVFIKNELLSLDIFNRTDIYSGYFKKILKGAALESHKPKVTSKPLEEETARFKTLDLLDKLKNLWINTHKGVSAGEERRFEEEEITGFELVFNKELIHLTALNLNEK